MTTRILASIVMMAVIANVAFASEIWERSRRQGVQLARMCVNEDSRPLRLLPGGTAGELTIDCKLILRVVEVNRFSKSTHKGWLDVMKWLSPHIGKLKEPKRHRHAVNSGLESYGDDPPSSWIDCKGTDGECDGDWRVHGPLWVEFREKVIHQWMMAGGYEFINIAPRTWGDRNDVIRTLKRTSKLCVLDMGERNFFLARPGEGCELNDPATVAAREGKRP